MHIDHNDHRSNYESVSEYLENHGATVEDFVDRSDMQKAIDTDEIWCLQWYPETPIGFHRVYGSTFEAALFVANRVDTSD